MHCLHTRFCHMPPFCKPTAVPQLYELVRVYEYELVRIYFRKYTSYRVGTTDSACCHTCRFPRSVDTTMELRSISRCSRPRSARPRRKGELTKEKKQNVLT